MSQDDSFKTFLKCEHCGKFFACSKTYQDVNIKENVGYDNLCGGCLQDVKTFFEKGCGKAKENCHKCGKSYDPVVMISYPGMKEDCGYSLLCRSCAFQ